MFVEKAELLCIFWKIIVSNRKRGADETGRPPGEYLLHLREKLRGPDRKVIKERINLNAEFTIPG